MYVFVIGQAGSYPARQHPDTIDLARILLRHVRQQSEVRTDGRQSHLPTDRLVRGRAETQQVGEGNDMTF